MDKLNHKTLKAAAIWAAAILAAALIWFGLWYGLLGYLPPHLLRVAAALLIGLTPLLLWLAYQLGLTRARDVLSGLDRGVDKVMDAANRTSDVKVTTAQSMRAVPARSATVPGAARAADYDRLLPDVSRTVIVQHQPAGDGDIVEM